MDNILFVWHISCVLVICAKMFSSFSVAQSPDLVCHFQFGCDAILLSLRPTLHRSDGGSGGGERGIYDLRDGFDGKLSEWFVAFSLRTKMSLHGFEVICVRYESCSFFFAQSSWSTTIYLTFNRKLRALKSTPCKSKSHSTTSFRWNKLQRA